MGARAMSALCQKRTSLGELKCVAYAERTFAQYFPELAANGKF
jgi:hypothetical protein